MQPHAPKPKQGNEATRPHLKNNNAPIRWACGRVASLQSFGLRVCGYFSLVRIECLCTLQWDTIHVGKTNHDAKRKCSPTLESQQTDLHRSLASEKGQCFHTLDKSACGCISVLRASVLLHFRFSQQSIGPPSQCNTPPQRVPCRQTELQPRARMLKKRKRKLN